MTTMFLFLASGANSGALIDQLQAAFAGREDIVIQSTHSVREASMFIFDRSFTITIALQLVGHGGGFYWRTERADEFGIGPGS